MKLQWYFTAADSIPFYLDPLPWGATMPCRIPVVPGGDGAETKPLEERTAKCGHRAEVLIGSGAVCGHHIVQFFRTAGTKLDQDVPPC